MRRGLPLLIVVGLAASLAACGRDGGAYAVSDTLPDVVTLGGLPEFGDAPETAMAETEPSSSVPAGSTSASPAPAEPAPAAEEPAVIAGPAVVGGGAEAVRTEPGLRRATFAFTGDTLLHSPLVAQAALPGGGYDFSPMYSRVQHILAGADFAICHLETPVAPAGEPLSTYPHYGVPAAIGVDLAEAGYDRCSTASNHTFDRGLKGVDATVEALVSAGVSQAGMARWPEEAVAPITDVNGIPIAHLSFSSHFNGASIPANQPWRSSLISPTAVINAANDARARGAKVVIVSMHWGTEGLAAPDAMQRNVADKVMASGAVDLIVGHHAHMLQPIEQVHGRWVLFGLGNFISNMPNGGRWPPASQDGVIVTVTLAEQPDGSYAFETPVAIPTWVDRDRGWTIYDVIPDRADPALPNVVRSQLEVSLSRTKAVLGPYVPA